MYARRHTDFATRVNERPMPVSLDTKPREITAEPKAPVKKAPVKKESSSDDDSSSDGDSSNGEEKPKKKASPTVTAKN